MLNKNKNKNRNKMEEKQQKCNKCYKIKNIDDYSTNIYNNKKYKTCEPCREVARLYREKSREIPVEQIEGKSYCVRCKKHYDISDFSINTKTNEQYKNCNKCRVQSKEYIENEENHLKKIQRGRIRYQNTKEQQKIYKKEYKKKNREQLLQKSREYYQKNKERCAEYFQTNKEKILEVRNKFLENNPDKKVLRAARSRLTGMVRNLIKDLKINMTPSEYKKSNEYEGFYDLLGCTQEFFVEWISSQFDDNMSWDNHGKYWHVDHTFPCCKIDVNNEEERKMCFGWKNLRPVEKSENISKGGKIIEDLIERQFLLANEFEQNY